MKDSDWVPKHMAFLQEACPSGPRRTTTRCVHYTFKEHGSCSSWKQSSPSALWRDINTKEPSYVGFEFCFHRHTQQGLRFRI